LESLAEASEAEAQADRTRQRAGVLSAIGAYVLWGLMPLYLMLLRGIPPLEILMHRMVWAAVFVAAILTLQRRWAWFPLAFRSPRVWGTFVASAAVLAVNWFIYVWSVSHGRVVDASLGYFINPLFSIALGAVLLKERLALVRRVGVAFAVAGVVWLTIQVGQVPWIGLALAASFGTYGLLRKVAPLGALEGLALETLLLSPLALATLAWLAAHGQSDFVDGGLAKKALLLAAGPVTAVPLLLFAAGARRIPLSLLGLLQYLGPTLQLFIGVLVGGEPFGGGKLVGYALIWLGFAIASTEGLRGASGRKAGRTAVVSGGHSGQ
jgi:chloramphenicol-sensitive protein RarD